MKLYLKAQSFYTGQGLKKGERHFIIGGMGVDGEMDWAMSIQIQ